MYPERLVLACRSSSSVLPTPDDSPDGLFLGPHLLIGLSRGSSIGGWTVLYPALAGSRLLLRPYIPGVRFRGRYCFWVVCVISEGSILAWRSATGTVSSSVAFSGVFAFRPGVARMAQLALFAIFLILHVNCGAP